METGLEAKPWYFGLGLGLAITLAVAAFFHFKGFDGIRKKIAVEENRIADFEQKILEGEAARKNLPQFQDQVARLEQELDKLLRILPARKNTPELIRRIRVLTEQAGFNLKVFDPAERLSDQEFYRVWPIKIDLLGGYHELALFFDRISRLSRIINIENLKITSHRRQESFTITARFTAKTFVYKEPEEEPEQEPTGKERRAR